MLPKHWEELTLASSPDEIVVEFSKKYKGAFVWFCVNEKEPVLCIFKNYARDENNEWVFQFLSNKFGVLTCKLKSDVVIRANFPTSGCFTHMKDFYVVSRIPARQYRKSPTKDNCIITHPLSDLEGFFDRPRGMNFLEEAVLISAYNKIKIPFDGGCAAILAGKGVGFAINSLFAISRHIEKDKLLLWHLNKPVGELEDNKIIIKVPELEQEIVDLIRRENLGVTIA